MAHRQSLPVILAALMPDNLVRCVWLPSGQPGTSQITGRVLRTSDDLLSIFPLQGHGKRPKTINLDRVHSVVVLREGERAMVERSRAADHLRRAAYWLGEGDTDRARAHITTAGVTIPGLLPRPSRSEE